MNVNVRSSECAWFNADIKLLGRSLKGVTAYEHTKSVDKEAIYGAGQHALDIQEGNIACSGSITVYGYELAEMNQAAQAAGYDDILSIPHETVVITVTYRKTLADPIETHVCSGVSFTEIKQAQSQNDKKREIPLPFLCMDIQTKTIKI